MSLFSAAFHHTTLSYSFLGFPLLPFLHSSRTSPSSSSSVSVTIRGGGRRGASGLRRRAVSDGGPYDGEDGRYHPSEDVVDEGRLSHSEVCRTIVEVNSKATLILSGLIEDEIQENILWPQLSYLTDEHGDIYIKVDGEEHVLQTLTSGDNSVQLVIGIDNIERIAEVELSTSSGIHFGMEEINDEDFDSDVDFDQDIVVISDDEEDGQSELGPEPYGDWENMETMSSSHPMYFARKIAECVSDMKSNWMDPPSTGLIVQGLIRPALAEEHSIVQEKNRTSEQERFGSAEVGAREEDGLQKETAFYKLEMINIHLISANGNLCSVKVQDYRQAQPDVIAHSEAKIISRLKSGGDKTVQAFKSLCWRMKGIHVEEVDIIGVDSLGFDLRTCSGTQIQNLRFAFNSRATSEYSAERQLHDLLFPRIQNKQQEKHQANPKEP